MFYILDVTGSSEYAYDIGKIIRSQTSKLGFYPAFIKVVSEEEYSLSRNEYASKILRTLS